MKKLFVFFFLGLFLISFSSAINTDNLVSYYKLDELSGSILDSHGTNNGTNNGADYGLVGKINNSLDFENSQDDYVSLPQGIPTSLSSSAFTINMWIKPETNFISTTGIRTLFDSSGTNRLQIDYNGFPGDLRFFYSGVNTRFTTTFTAGQWYMLTFTVNESSNKMYINGNLNATIANGGLVSIGTATTNIGENYIVSPGRGMDGLMDEISFFDSDIGITAIQELYNNGSGLIYPFVEISPEISLLSPNNNTIISDVGTNFTISGNNLSFINADWTNITFNVYLNGTIFNSTTVDFADEVIFNQTLFIDNFGFEDYEWGGYACYENITGSYCISSDYNNTFSISLFTVVNETYVNDTLSGTLESFSISINLLEGYDLLQADFIYNGTSTSPGIYSQGNNRYLLISSYPMPILTADENITFNWDLTFTGDIMLSTENNTQLVRALLIDNCDVYTNKIFGVNLFDENTRNSINGSIEINYRFLNIPFYNEIASINYSVMDVSSYEFCTDLNIFGEEIAYSAEIRYYADGYSSELYNIQRKDLPSSSENVSLFLLNESSSTNFKITYQDSTFNFVEGAIIQLQRKYIGLDQYETVEAPLTSNEGTAVLHINLNSILYRATVVKNGVILDEFDNLVFQCQSELTGECEQSLLGEIDPRNDIDFDTTRDFSYDISRENNTITVTFSIPSGLASSVNVQLIHKDSFSNTSICNKTIVSSAGSIDCTFTDTIGDSYIDLFISKGGVPMAETSYIIKESGGVDFLQNNFIIVVVLILTLTGLSITSPEWIVLTAILALMISGALWLVNGLDFVVGLGLLGFLLVGAVIIILKLAKQEDR